MKMTEKILVPSYNKEQKETLHKRVMEEDVMSSFPELRKDYRWYLKVSKNALLVFELELQKKELLLWKRSKRFNVSLQNMKDNGSVEGCLKQCANDLIKWEEETLSESMKKVNWIIEED